MFRNRAKERRRARNEPEILGIVELESLEPLGFRVGVQLWGDFPDRLDAAAPSGAPYEIGDVQAVALGPTLPRARDDRLGINEDAVEVEQDCSKGEDDCQCDPPGPRAP